MPSTEELVRATQAGENSAFAELVRCYERAAVITAHSVLLDFHLAQDVAQEGFVIAYQRLGQLRDAASFGPWLLRIVRRQALRLRRGRNAERIGGGMVERAAAEPRDWIEPYQEVVQRIARLPEHERVVVVMRYVDGRSVKEIADSTGRPAGTITKQLSRAIGRLRNWMAEVRS
jgi:RNA polymerase sigma-70 factor, ECF subfamily